MTAALLFNRDTSSFLFMMRESSNSWIPDLNMLNIHRTARPPPRIYRFGDTTTYISVDNNGTERTWGTLDGSATIRQIVEGPWISNDEIYQEFPADDIAAFDAWIRELSFVNEEGPGRPEWEDHLRPQIEIPMRPPYVLITLHEAPTAPPAPRPPLPAHIAAAMISHAVATGATCPITMEPIQTTTATITSCGHVFTTSALRNWLSTHSTCPECRQPL
jgi:hypothetical protein